MTAMLQNSVRTWTGTSEDDLYVHIGRQAVEVTRAHTREALLQAGRNIVKRWHLALHDIICGKDEEATALRQDILKALKADQNAIAAAIAALMVAQFGLLAAVAAPVSVIIVKRLGKPVVDELCSAWDAALK